MAAELMMINPRHDRRRKVTRKRRAHRRSRRVTYAARNPRRRSRRRVSRRISRVTRARRNPTRYRRARRAVGRSVRRVGSGVRGIFGGMVRDLLPAGAGAAGALALDAALGYVPLPSFAQSGVPNALTRIAGAFGIGWLGGLVAGKKFGEEMAVGAVTVTLYDLAKAYFVQNDPWMFGPTSSTTTSANTATAIQGAAIAAQQNSANDQSGLGWVSPAMQVGRYVSGTGVYVD